MFILLLLFKTVSLVSSSCVANSDCTVPTTPYCLGSSGTCVGCTTSSQCLPNLCVSNSCSSCNSNSACASASSSTPICFSGKCVQCGSNGDCPSATPFCSSNSCVQCIDSTGCTSPTAPVCSSSNTCGPCTSAPLCMAAFPSLPYCSSGICSECAVSSNCPSTMPVCNSLGSCQICSSDSQCEQISSLKPYCSSGVCLECAHSSNCPSTMPVCNSLGSCQICSSDSQCEQISSLTPYCSMTGACAQCSANKHCVEPSSSACNTVFGTCESCDNPNDCSHLTATPICSSNMCVQCIGDTDCSTGKKCDSHSFTCVSQFTCLLTVVLKETIDNGYKLSVGISHEACVDPTVTNLLLAIQGLTLNVDYSYKTHKINSQNYEITLLALKSMDISQLQVVVTYNAALVGNIELDPIIYLSETEQKIASGIGSTSTGNLAILGFSTFAFALLGKLSTTWSFVAISQYISYLLYLNVRYPQQTKTYFRSIKGYGLLLPWKSDSDDSDSLSELLNYKNAMPQRFYEEEYPVEFLHNTLQIFVLIFGSLFLLGVLKILFLHDKLKPLFLRKLLVSLRWNAIIRKICTYALPLCAAAFLQMYIAVFSNETNVFENIVAVLSVLGLLVAVSKMTISITKIPKQRRSKKIFHVGKYGTLWSGLNVQYNLGMYYNIIVTLRGILLGYLVVFQEVFGLLQLVPLILYQVFVLAVFFKGFQRQLVFSDKDLNIFCGVQENLLMILKLLIFLYYFLEGLMGVTNTHALSRLGWVIILPAFSVQLLQSLYSFYLMYRERKLLYVKLQKIGRKIFCIKPKWSKKIERARKSTSVSTIQSDSLELSPA